MFDRVGALHEGRHDLAVAAFHRQRRRAREIAHIGAVIVRRIGDGVGRHQDVARAAEGISCPRTVARLRRRRAGERRRDGRVPFAAARVAEVAQVAEVHLTHPRQHIEGIGAHIVVIGIRRRLLTQPLRAALQRIVGHDEALLLRLRQEIEREDGEPRIGIRARSPHAEIAGEVLHVEHVVDGILQALRQRLVLR